MTDKLKTANRSGTHAVAQDPPVKVETEEVIVALTGDDAVRRLASDLNAHGVSLRLMALVQAPDNVRRGARGPQTWIDPREPEALRLGVTARTKVEQAVWIGARALAALEDFPDTSIDSQAELMVDAYAYAYVGSVCGAEALNRTLRAFLTRAARRRAAEGHPDAQTVVEYASAAWPLLAALSIDGRERAVGQLARIVPKIEPELESFERRFGTLAPVTGREATSLLLGEQ